MSALRNKAQGQVIWAKGESMWDTVGIVAAVVVIVLLIQLLDVVEALKMRIKGGSSPRNLNQRMTELERRMDSLERKAS